MRRLYFLVSIFCLSQFNVYGKFLEYPILFIDNKVKYFDKVILITEGDSLKFRLDSSMSSAVYLDLKNSLNSIQISTFMEFDCANNPEVEFCGRYKTFAYFFDLVNSTLTLEFETLNPELKSSPLAVSNVRTFFSGENNAMDYSSMITTNIGVAEDSFLSLDSRLSNHGLNFLTGFSYFNPLGVSKDFTFSFNKNGYASTPFTNLNGVYTLLYQNNRDLNDFDEYEQTSFYSEFVGQFNVRALNGDLINAFDARRGMNFIKLDRSIYGKHKSVIIELIVDGKVVGNREHNFNWALNRSQKMLGTASVSVAKDDISRNQKILVSFGGELFDKFGYAVNTSTENEFGLSLDYRVKNGFSVSGDVYSSENRESKIFNIYNGWENDYFSLNTRISTRHTSYEGISANSTTLFLGMNKMIGDYSLYGSYYWVSDSNTSEISAHIAKSYDISNARLNVSFDVKTDVEKNDYSIGLNFTYTPENRGRVTPSGSVFYNGKVISSSAEAEYKLTESSKLSGKLGFDNAKLQAYGSSYSYSDQYLNGSVSAYHYVNTGNTSFNGSVSASAMISENGFKLAKYDQTSLVNFQNKLKNHDVNKVMLDSVSYDVTNGDSIGISGGKKIKVYSPDGMLDFGDKNIVTVPMYRSSTIEFSSKINSANEVVVFGRIVDELNGLPDLMVKNHSTHTKTSTDGYFSLSVDRNNPIVTIMRDGKKCNEIDIDIEPKGSSSIYLGRIQCETINTAKL